MINAVLKLSEIKKDPTVLLGWDRNPAMITRYGDVVAYVVSPERMQQLLEAEHKINAFKTGFQTGSSSMAAVANHDIGEVIKCMNEADRSKLAY